MLLRAPQGSTQAMDGSGMSMGSNTVTMSTHLRTRLKAAEVAAHYDKQMREQGWSAVSDGAIETLAARTYRKTDEKKRTWTGVLFSMNAADAAEQDVFLRLTSKP